ncbi:MAG TPA: cobalt ECF transporter T component CbiQ [Candidatus Omnitrophota bacterium]|nr:cobalt ECF transporter T component CbiQ [Candidatus Omnitrophota bacterium]HQO37944.1 cobalt ECF transporter T component CbiQ [Candidatus Omnitrophota bacterium]HQQ05449.1 cobalt ECF transporter T component CbiQ [Candidatus Omnitrophota bacterium]
MKHAFLDEYSRLDSILHRRDPVAKIIALFACIVFVVLTPPEHMRSFVLYFFVLSCLVAISRVPPLFVMKRSFEMMPIVFCIALFIPFYRSGVAVFSLNIGPARLAVTHTGLLLMWNVLVKAYLSIVCSILLVNTTDFVDLLKGFERLRMPRLLVMIVSFMYRYLFVIEDELEKMQVARASRCAREGGWGQIRTLANIVGVLFIRSYEKAETVYLAMCCRGYTGPVRAMHDWRMTRNDVYFCAFVFIILILIRFSGV